VANPIGLRPFDFAQGRPEQGRRTRHGEISHRGTESTESTEKKNSFGSGVVVTGLEPKAQSRTPEVGMVTSRQMLTRSSPLEVQDFACLVRRGGRQSKPLDDLAHQAT
jgi:hypothetical protein